MINLRWKTDKITGKKTLQMSCAFNITQLSGAGPLSGLCLLVPAPPGAKIAWLDVQEQIVDPNDEKGDIAVEIPEANKVLAPAGARQPIVKPEDVK